MPFDFYCYNCRSYEKWQLDEEVTTHNGLVVKETYCLM